VAAAAHELGTPLATIALVAKELQRGMPKEGPVAEDVALLREQVQRCRAILARLSSLDSDPYGPMATLTLRQLLEEMAGPARPVGVAVRVQANGIGPEPYCRRNPGVIYGLSNLVDNAIDFAREAVVLSAQWNGETVTIEIYDDGPGFRPEVLLRAGEPYLTTRAQDHQRHSGGMGLGLFIAKTLLERSGGALAFANRPAPATGALARIVWQRASFERRSAESTQEAQEAG
jgi:two-component system sensor histidine kinase RegB